MQHEGYSDINRYSFFGTVKKTWKRLDDLEISGRIKPPTRLLLKSDYSKSLGDLRRLVVTQSSMKNCLLELVWERHKEGCIKLAQKEYKTRLDWEDKVIHWEMCKKLRFDHTNKWYMQKPTAVLENDIHRLLWNFDIQNGSPYLGQKIRSYNN